MRAFKIKLKRVGRWKKPVYAVVVSFKDISPKSGKYFEKLGFYAPMADPKFFFINFARAAYWVARGATLSSAVGVLLSKTAPKRLPGRLKKYKLFKV